LDEHVDRSAGIWLKIAKKGSSVASLTDDEAVDVGLCFGWISGQRKAFDDAYYLQKYVPRRPRSRWSQVNARKVEELMAAGRMRPPRSCRGRGRQGRWALGCRVRLPKRGHRPARPRSSFGCEPSCCSNLRIAQQDRPLCRGLGRRHRAHDEDQSRAHSQGRHDPRDERPESVIPYCSVLGRSQTTSLGDLSGRRPRQTG
jgi:hypothetical protein